MLLKQTIEYIKASLKSLLEYISNNILTPIYNVVCYFLFNHSNDQESESNNGNEGINQQITSFSLQLDQQGDEFQGNLIQLAVLDDHSLDLK